MFGRKPKEPPETRELVLDRIGLAEAASVNLEVWWATFVGQTEIQQIHLSTIGMENKHHLVLARRGDRIRIYTRKGRIVGFQNLELG